MDPTKSFDHLDPKLKDTYARVMGTSTPVADNASVPAPADPTLSTLPPVPAASQALNDPVQSQINANPLPQSYNSGDNPNPGTGPTVNSVPTATSTMFATPEQTATPTEPPIDPMAPTTSTFFSNPSPVSTDPSQTGDPVVQAPVTPYTPETIAGGQPSLPSEPFTQPLPSPATVAQSSTHQTSALLKVLYIIAAAVFFAVYTIFWIKVFNLPFIF